HLNQNFNKLKRVESLNLFEKEMYFLKDTIDILDDVNGWPFLLVISNTTLYVFNNLDYMFEASALLHSWERVVADVILTFIVFVIKILFYYKLFSFSCRLAQQLSSIYVI